jgi:hypothetical protein
VIPLFSQNLGGVWRLAKWVIFRAPGAGTKLVDLVLDRNHCLNEAINFLLWL